MSEESSRGSKVRWRGAADDYAELIGNASLDSAYLRSRGLEPTVVDLAGNNTAELRVLDVGTRTGWLFERLKTKSAHGCDLRVLTDLPSHVQFTVADLAQLPYKTGKFDLVVASMVLIWCPDLRAAARELARVSAPGGRLVVAIVHPYFYRTGEIRENSDYVLTTDLSNPCSLDVMIGGRAGPYKYYYHRLDSYFGELIDAGWQVDGFDEWFLDEADLAAESTIESPMIRSGKIPYYCFFQCSRLPAVGQ